MEGKNIVRSLAWRCMAITPAIRKQGQKDCEFKTNLGYKEDLKPAVVI